ncbi:protein kinase [Rubripirellula sp.]|nr:serine/threonine-protein kinase [Rubripirellula sp.]MDB4749550.1 protein kinase [Rubripirellula sp.]
MKYALKKQALSMQQSTDYQCPRCQTLIGADAPHGLCPKCVLDAVAKSGTQAQSKPVAYPSVDEVAKAFPELEIIEVIGVGGMGVVYKACQRKLGRLVALKLLSTKLAEHSVFVERFNREGQVLAQLNHPHIVNVFDFGSRGDFLYLLMEYVDGVNLREAMQAGTIASADCLILVQDICSALQFAHDQGVLHRDIKPENVLLDQDGRVKLADFGIAKLVSSEARDNVSLTQHGAVLGTLHYMAPEQLETPGSIDHRADIYSLGVVFYELLTGELPLGRFPSPSDASNADPRLDKVVLRALEKRRDRRYQTVNEVKTDVESLKSTPGNIMQARTVDLAPTSVELRDRSKGGGWISLAVVSAILTGVSLLLGIAVALFAYARLSQSPNGVSLAFSGFAVLVALPTVPAALGAVCGLIALFQRNTTSLVSSLFAVLLWPVLLGVVFLIYFTGFRGTPAGGFSANNGQSDDLVVDVLSGNPEIIASTLLEVDLGNGKTQVNVTHAPNVGLWESPPLGKLQFPSHRVVNLEMIESADGVCVVDVQRRSPAIVEYDAPGGMLEKLLGGKTNSPRNTVELQETQTEFSDWQLDRAFPIFDQAQLDKFVRRIEVPIKTDTKNYENLDESNRFPKIDFETQMAVVIVNFGSRSKPSIVTQVKCEELGPELTESSGSEQRVWIDVSVPKWVPNQSFLMDESGRTSGAFTLVVFQKPDVFDSLNFRYTQL